MNITNTGETMATIKTDGNRIIAKTHYKEKDKAKSVQGSRWKPNRKAWQFPHSPFVAKELVDTFGESDCASDVIQLADRAKTSSVAKNPDDLPQPKVRKTDAWDHQKLAYHFGKNINNVAYFLNMGLGKSKIAIDLIQNRGHDTVAIVCPKSVINVWGREFNKHCAKEFMLANPTKRGVRERLKQIQSTWEKAVALNKISVCVFNYEAVLNDDLYDWLKATDIECMVADEMHRVKAPGGKQSRALYRIGKTIPHKIGLTGTPLPHSPLDIYAQYRFLEPGIFGTSFAQFKSRYAVTRDRRINGNSFSEVVGYQRKEELHDKMYQIAYKGDPDVLDLPDQHTTERYCTLDEKTMKHYHKLNDQFITFLQNQEVVSADNALVKLLRLQQLTSGYIKTDEDNIRTIGTEKEDLFRDIATDIGDEPIVVFCRFKYDLQTIRDVTDDLGREYGEVSGSQNDLTDDAEYPEDVDVLGVQIQSGSVGINLTRARYAIYYSTGFSLGDYQQSKKRLHRPGQENDVVYIHLVAEDTIDEQVLEALDKREEVVNHVLSDFETEVGFDE